MQRRNAVLAAASVVVAALASAGEVPVPEIPYAPFVSPAPAHAMPEPARDAQPPAARLVWMDPASAALGTEAVVRPEVTRLLREMGVAGSWRKGGPHEIAQPGELRVIFLDRPSATEHGVPVLGATPTSFLADRFVWVHVPSVRAAAGVSSLRAGPSLDPHSARRLGIAMARVIAHEVVHALAPAVPHGTGLMASRLDRRTLTAPSIKVDPEVGLALRRALALPQAAGAAAASDAVLAVESGYKEPYL
jgi:hypothetical protein